MTHATRAGSGWALLPYGEDVTYQGVTASYATVMLWSDAEREAFGVFAVPEPDAAPEGQMEAGRALVDKDGRPVWAVTYQPISTPELAPIPDGPTNSDWRVGLRIWGRFAEVEAAVIAARDSGTLEGGIAWDRFEYANNVYRSELMRLRDALGFSAEDVDESLRRAAAVSAQARA
jgi:hypothetical protein